VEGWTPRIRSDLTTVVKMGALIAASFGRPTATSAPFGRRYSSAIPKNRKLKQRGREYVSEKGPGRAGRGVDGRN
jgi:hypothetical protein